MSIVTRLSSIAFVATFAACLHSQSALTPPAAVVTQRVFEGTATIEGIKSETLRHTTAEDKARRALEENVERFISELSRAYETETGHVLYDRPAEGPDECVIMKPRAVNATYAKADVASRTENGTGIGTAKLDFSLVANSFNDTDERYWQPTEEARTWLRAHVADVYDAMYGSEPSK